MCWRMKSLDQVRTYRMMLDVNAKRHSTRGKEANTRTGIKEFSDWPTIPQLYVNKEFVGGTDIMMSMHQDGSLAKLLEEQDVLVPAEASDASSTSS